jgi:hypothetical protein
MSNGLNATKPKRHASRTALGVAALRAVHQLIGGAPKILDDPISAYWMRPPPVRALFVVTPQQARRALAIKP